MIKLVELQYGETINTITDAIKNDTLNDLYTRDFESNDPLQVVCKYVTDQQFEVEIEDIDSPLYLIFPNKKLKKYNYKIIDYAKGLYEAIEIKINNPKDKI